MAFKGLEPVPTPQSPEPTSGNGNSETEFVSPLIRPEYGLRIFRWLPKMENGEPVVDEDGDIVIESPVEFAEYWLVSPQGPGKPRIPNYYGYKGSMAGSVRVFVNPNRPFDNPVWNMCLEDLAKGDPAKKVAKRLMAVNVINRTPVVVLPTGPILFPNQDNEYWHKVRTDTGTKMEKIEGIEPKVLNNIMVLEVSSGSAGYDHIRSKIDAAMRNALREGSDGVEYTPNPVTYDLRLQSIVPQGADNKSVQRTVSVGSSKPLNNKELWNAPRYDLSYYSPWPDEALVALIEGADAKEVREEFGLDYLQLNDNDGENKKKADDIPF